MATYFGNPIAAKIKNQQMADKHYALLNKKVKEWEEKNKKEIDSSTLLELTISTMFEAWT
jgi:hypothetical protein